MNQVINQWIYLVLPSTSGGSGSSILCICILVWYAYRTQSWNWSYDIVYWYTVCHWYINTMMVVVWWSWTTCARGGFWDKDNCDMYWHGAWRMSEFLISLLIYCSISYNHHRTTARKSMTNYHRTIVGRKILHNTMTRNMMSSALCLRCVGSIVSIQNHSLPSPFSSIYKLN